MKKIQISEKLFNILKQIEDQSYVAKLLLNSEDISEMLVDSPINYLSVSCDDESKISYLTDERFQTIQDSSEIWTSKKRFHCKPGAFVNKIFRNVSFFEIEKFSTLFRSQSMKKDFTFEIVSGYEIKNWYVQDSYESCSGSLGVSCMRYENCKSYFDIYTNNSQISMLIARNPKGFLIGRALLWNLPDHKIMDRIYTVCDEDYQGHFKKWAYDNGYLHKSRQNWSNTMQFDSKVDKFIELKLSTKLEKFQFEYFPYLDTFKWLDKFGNLYNWAPEGSEFITLSNPNGGFERYNYLEFDQLGRDWHQSGNLIWIPENRLLTSERFLNYSEYLDKYILKSESEYSNKYRDYIYKDSSKNDWGLLNYRLDIFQKSQLNDEEQKTPLF